MRIRRIAMLLWPPVAPWGTLPGLLLTAALLTGCGLQQDIDVDLPPAPDALMVECYLENGKIPEASVSNVVDYLSTPQNPAPTDVTVLITGPTGRVDTLRFLPGRNRQTRKLYTHRGTRALSIRPGDTYRFSAADTRGRRVTGTATMPALVPIDTVEWKFNDLPPDQRRAYVLTKFRDPAGVGDAYRYQIHKGKITGDPETNYYPEDRLLDGQAFTLGTGYDFKANDTLFVTLYHLDRPYFNFLRSTDDARQANGNPFAQPAAVQSTVEGGVGVFTILSYQRRSFILP